MREFGSSPLPHNAKRQMARTVVAYTFALSGPGEVVGRRERHALIKSPIDKAEREGAPELTLRVRTTYRDASSRSSHPSDALCSSNGMNSYLKSMLHHGIWGNADSACSPLPLLKLMMKGSANISTSFFSLLQQLLQDLRAQKPGASLLPVLRT